MVELAADFLIGVLIGLLQCAALALPQGFVLKIVAKHKLEKPTTFGEAYLCAFSALAVGLVFFAVLITLRHALGWDEPGQNDAAWGGIGPLVIGVLFQAIAVKRFYETTWEKALLIAAIMTLVLIGVALALGFVFVLAMFAS